MNTINRTILIVDDEKDLREALATTFTNEGFITLTAEDGEVGLATALAQKPDIILLDVMMPKMDGLAMLKNFRQHPEGKNTKVIVMTAQDDLNKVAEMIATGVDEYIMKTSITLVGIVAKVKEKLGLV